MRVDWSSRKFGGKVQDIEEALKCRESRSRNGLQVDSHGDKKQKKIVKLEA
jgi:hypothetical protein